MGGASRSKKSNCYLPSRRDGFASGTSTVGKSKDRKGGASPKKEKANTWRRRWKGFHAVLKLKMGGGGKGDKMVSCRERGTKLRRFSFEDSVSGVETSDKEGTWKFITSKHLTRRTNT